MKTEKVILSILIAMAVASTALVLFSRQKPSEAVTKHEVKQLVGTTPTKRTAVRSKPIKETKAKSAVPKMTIQQKLDSIIIPEIDFQDTPFQTALEFLVSESQRLDPEGIGVSVILEDCEDEEMLRKITVTMHDAPLIHVLKYATVVTGFRYRIENDGVILRSKLNPKDFVTRSFPADPTLMKAFVHKLSPPGKSSLSMSKLIEEFGIELPAGTSITYDEMQKILVVKHTPQVLDQIELIVVRLDPSKAVIIKKLDTIKIKPIHWDYEVSALVQFQRLSDEIRKADPEENGVNIVVNFDTTSFDAERFATLEKIKTEGGRMPSTCTGVHGDPLSEVPIMTIINEFTYRNGWKYRIESEAIYVESNDQKQ
jgi:hypothetical protein